MHVFRVFGTYCQTASRDSPDYIPKLGLSTLPFPITLPTWVTIILYDLASLRGEIVSHFIYITLLFLKLSFFIFYLVFTFVCFLYSFFKFTVANFGETLLFFFICNRTLSSRVFFFFLFVICLQIFFIVFFPYIRFYWFAVFCYIMYDGFALSTKLTWHFNHIFISDIYVIFVRSFCSVSRYYKKA